MAWIWHKRDLVVSGIFAEWKIQGLSIIGGDRLREEDTTKEEERGNGKLLGLQIAAGEGKVVVVGWASMVVC